MQTDNATASFRAIFSPSLPDVSFRDDYVIKILPEQATVL
jgi:hypothetical protein